MALDLRSPQHDQVQEIIIYLRKALSQQKQLEQSCRRTGKEVEYRWSLNEPKATVAEVEDSAFQA